LSYKKTRLIPSRHPDTTAQTVFVNFIFETIYQSNFDGDVVLFLDPVHQVHNIDSDYCWQLVGGANTKKVNSNSGRQRLTILGALNALTKKTTIFSTESNCDHYAMQVFLREIRNDYPDPKIIYIFLDNARYNHSVAVREEAEALGIKLLFLPPYSPNLNLIERLWKFMKKKVTANIYYRTFAEFTQAIHNFFKNIEQYQTELDTLLTLNFEII
jgi:transposase